MKFLLLLALCFCFASAGSLAQTDQPLVSVSRELSRLKEEYESATDKQSALNEWQSFVEKKFGSESVAFRRYLQEVKEGPRLESGRFSRFAEIVFIEMVTRVEKPQDAYDAMNVARVSQASFLPLFEKIAFLVSMMPLPVQDRVENDAVRFQGTQELLRQWINVVDFPMYEAARWAEDRDRETLGRLLGLGRVFVGKAKEYKLRYFPGGNVSLNLAKLGGEFSELTLATPTLVALPGSVPSVETPPTPTSSTIPVESGDGCVDGSREHILKALTELSRAISSLKTPLGGVVVCEKIDATTADEVRAALDLIQAKLDEAKRAIGPARK